MPFTFYQTRSKSTKQGVQTGKCLVTKQCLMVFGRQTFPVCPGLKGVPHYLNTGQSNSSNVARGMHAHVKQPLHKNTMQVLTKFNIHELSVFRQIKLCQCCVLTIIHLVCSQSERVSMPIQTAQHSIKIRR